MTSAQAAHRDIACTVAAVAAVLQATRLPLQDEKQTQACVSEALHMAGVGHRREVRLSRHDIADFVINEDIVMELKIKGQRAAMVRQLSRYAEHAHVRALILATARCADVPPTLNGKPVFLLSLAQAWL